MINRGLVENGERSIKRTAGVITRKSGKRAVLAGKINLEEYSGLCEIWIRSLFLAATELSAAGHRQF